MRRRIFLIIALALASVAPLVFIESALFARVASVACVCLVLWISESVPPFVPTLLLWTLAPLVLAPLDGKFALPNVLGWAIDPVLALFFGGFVLGVATERFGLDKRLARFALRSAGKSFALFLLLVIFLTAFLSMWLSNIASAALMLACLRPFFTNIETDSIYRRALLVGVALGADFGGIATPIGTGPNAIAIASIADAQKISFLGWMAFAFPLTIGMLLAGFLLLLRRIRKNGNDWAEKTQNLNHFQIVENDSTENRNGQTAFLFVLAATVVLWLTEPLHGIPAAVVSLGAAAFLFLSGMLGKEDLLRVDWSTLILIAGGITLGKLLEQSAIVKTFADNLPFAEMNPTLSLFLLCLASALLSALMSNTATVVMLIPLAVALVPAPSTAILIAVSASFGIPFIISTPPNAMAYGEGGVKFTDLFAPGILLMILGCLIVSLTGRSVLNFAGIP